MKIRYNAPTVLSFTLLCALVMVLSETLLPNLNKYLFMVPGRKDFNPVNLLNWIMLFTHVLGHANWEHLIGNFTLILLIGPMLEENHGSTRLLLMMGITALVTGILNVLLFPSALMGASGIVFMMILLSSFTNFSKGEVPLTFILVLFLYMGIQVLNSFKTNNISEFAHIIGGLCGSIFGFLFSIKSTEHGGRKRSR